MFNLPPGIAVDPETDLSVGQNQMPFETGAISYYKPRAKTACAHRLIYGGRVVGWLAEAEAKQTFVTGEAAKNRLLELSDSHDLNARGISWSAEQFTDVARCIPEAFSDPSDVASLLAQGAAALPIETTDLALLVDKLTESDEVLGALAFEDGVVIHSSGDLPSTAEDLATLGQEHLSGLASKFEQSESLSANLRLEGGQLMLTEAGQESVAIWCRHGADAHAALSNAASLVGTIDDGDTVDNEELPEGFITKESKSGVDQLISHLRTAHEDRLTGYLQSVSESAEPISIMLVDGVPVGLRDSDGASLTDAVHSMTTSSRRLLSHRLERRARLSLTGSTVDDYSLAHLTDAITNCRTRSDDRKRLISGRLDALFGFDLGLEAMESGRATWKMLESGGAMAKLMPVSSSKVLTPASGEIKKRMEQLEHAQISLEREKGRLERELADARASRDEAREMMHDLESSLSEARDERSGLHRELDDLSAKVRAAESETDEAASLSSRLSKRVSELEHMIENRAEELASALG